MLNEIVDAENEVVRTILIDTMTVGMLVYGVVSLKTWRP